MPYLKKIELKGFKSFGPQTVTVNLDKGFTVVTGPNGSGKSNIVDAVLFVLGELSSRRLRAENFSRLIFHGITGEGEEKVKSAKVVIQFDNSDGRPRRRRPRPSTCCSGVLSGLARSGCDCSGL